MAYVIVCALSKMSLHVALADGSLKIGVVMNGKDSSMVFCV